MEETAFEPIDILYAEDERILREAYKRLLEGEGYHVRAVRNGRDALNLYGGKKPDLLLLDVDMPVLNGLQTCAEIREMDPGMPILFLTAQRQDETQVKAFGCGADDYIGKEVSDSILLLRIAAVLRRAGLKTPPLKTNLTPVPIALGEEILELGDLRIDLVDRSMVKKGNPGRVIELTNSETQLLVVLSEAQGRLVTYQQIFAALCGEGCISTEDAVRKAVQRLREKLGRVGELIISKRGQGYRLLV